MTILAEAHDCDPSPDATLTCRPQVFVETTEGTLGSEYRKAVFRGYTDATFKTPAPRDELFGILGPTIRAEAGDKIVVHFLNRLPFNASVQVGGGQSGPRLTRGLQRRMVAARLMLV
jgi:FtsP/CotA-like multicopper oxidase with cupredoxin domain